MYGVPPGAETIEEQALREASIFQFKLAQKLSRFFNAAFLSLMLVRSINQWLQLHSQKRLKEFSYLCFALKLYSIMLRYHI